MYIVFDIGGTHIRVARSDDGRTLSAQISKDTPASFTDGIAVINEAIKELTKEDETILAIAGGIAGILNEDHSKLYYSPNLPGWEKESFKKALGHHSNFVFIENDAALAGLAEAHVGAGKDFDIVAYMTISTGIGGARIVGGKIDERRYSFEPGKQIIDNETMTSVEDKISGRSIEQKFHTEPKNVTDEKVWKEAAKDLAVAAFNLAMVWSPDVIVFGGPMILKKPGIDIEEVKKDLQSMPHIFPVVPELRLASIQKDNGLIGALEYVRQQIPK